MLDLSKNELYEIKMPEGEVLHIRKPSQKIYMRLIKIQRQEIEVLDAMDELYNLLLDIFNLNTDNKQYDEAYINNFDINTVGLVLNDYFNFVNGILGE